MATSEFPTSTLDPERLYGLLERVVAVQERTVAALDRLTPPAGPARPPLRLLEGGGGR